MDKVEAMQRCQEIIQFRDDKIKIMDLNIFTCVIGEKEVSAIEFILTDYKALQDKVDKIREKLKAEIKIKIYEIKNIEEQQNKIYEKDKEDYIFDKRYKELSTILLYKKIAKIYAEELLEEIE